MGKIINVIEQIINSKNIWVVVIGLLFILLGVAIGVFKQTWLIAGSSALSYMEENVVDYLAIFFGLFAGILGGIIFLGMFICAYFNINFKDYFNSPLSGIFPLLSAFFLAILCLIVIAIIRTRKEKNKENQ